MKNRDFRISEVSRKEMTFFDPIFETDYLNKFYRQAQSLSLSYNKSHDEKVSAAKIHTSAVLHLIYQTVISSYLRYSGTDPFGRISVLAEKNEACRNVLDFFNKIFPSELEKDLTTQDVVRAFFVNQIFNENPALLKAMKNMLLQDKEEYPEGLKAIRTMLGANLQSNGFVDSDDEDLFSFMIKPAKLFPDDLAKQITYILKNWDMFLPEELKLLLFRSLDYIKEEEHPHGFGGPGNIENPDYSSEPDYESFTEDRNWMPNVVMMAKSTLVWLDQLSKKYQRAINTLDQIPDEELDYLKDCGFTALWLIGLWERSPASKKIKNLCGNPDAESSAYSLKGYSISPRLGGWDSLVNLKQRCWQRGIRLASDMVPNHTGLDSDWLFNHPDYFVQQDYPPFPSYTYNGPDLSSDVNIEIKIEDHYFNRSDAAVTFRKRNKSTGETKYIFHGNDGTTMPWNDTAQLDFLNPNTREAVIQQILDVAKNFHIIRFDAAMTLTKRHIQRLWYPKPGTGGDIAGRTPHGMTDMEFNRLIPNEFWRDVVDRIQTEAPDTLLLAEAFWMMESYFVRTLGMHRVYNSAFMHMMKNQDNKKYRDSIKSTLVFDPDILKRYVNFMNNPDEETAIAQFGNGDKYFGVCTMLSTMPGLPMFGHGQIEGFREKYGMEYQRAYWDEKPDENLEKQHKVKIFPLLKRRYLFSECKYFQLFDVINNDSVMENIYAYTNGTDNEMTLVLFNNSYEHASGRIYTSAPKLNKTNRKTETVSLAQSLRISMSPRKYVIYRDIISGLYYITSSLNITENGFWVSLDGYQSKVLTEIREVEDVDGTYAKLCEKLNGRGVSNLEAEINRLYLEPFYEAIQSMKNQKFIKDIKSVLTGKSSSSVMKNIMLSIGTSYTYMEEISDTLAKLGLYLQPVQPSEILKLLSVIDKTSKKKIFSDGNTIVQNELAMIVSASLIIKPFVNANSSLEEILKISDSLMLGNFFDTDPLLIGRCAIMLSRMPKDIDELLNNSTFLKLIGSNEYQGVLWYRGEWFQECMYITVFSRAIHDNSFTEKKAEDIIQCYLKKDLSAGYQVQNLILEQTDEQKTE